MPTFYEGERRGGPFGEAVECRMELRDDDKASLAGSVAIWFLNCPGQSPVWSHYTLQVVHLRPIAGTDPPDVKVPGATHEFHLFALDPSAEHDPINPFTWLWLSPVNLQEQVQLPDDDAARTLARLCVMAMLDGELWAEPPLSGQREPWLSALVQTSAHLRGEPHAL